MSRFRYEAIDPAGKVSRGVLDEASAVALAERIQGQGYFLLRAEEFGPWGHVLEFLNTDLTLKRGMPRAVLAQLTRELSEMLGAGQDIDHALRFVIETTTNKRVKRVAATLRDNVRNGKSFAAALATEPAVFSRTYCNVVRAGESGGKLAESLSQLAEMLERESRLGAAITSALIYPALMLFAAVATIVLLLTVVLPQFTPIFAQAGAELPRPTRILIGLGDIARLDGGWILIGFLGAVLIGHRLLREPGIRKPVERLVLLLPTVGILVRRSQAARFMRTLGTLLDNGVGLVPALAIARDVLSILIAATVVDQAAGSVKSGVRLSASLEAGRFFPIQTIRLLQLGEETGKLAGAALRCAAIHDQQVQETVQRLVSLLVPTVTIVMGLAVAAIFGSLIAAMLSLNDLAQ